jgi:hypothetical protein
MDPGTNREYKDRLFKAVFGSSERRDYALSLYNAVNQTSYTDPDQLELFTIEDTVYMGMKNDVSYLFDGSLILFEQQSSYDPNMPLRGLFYFSRQYEKILGGSNSILYSSTRRKIPTPRYIVFYNGSRPRPEREVMKLSDSFEKPLAGKSPAVEVIADVYNIDLDIGSALFDVCRPLLDYSKFISYVRIRQKEGLVLSDAVDAAVDQAIEEGLLDGYFKGHRAEVAGMILSEYKEEEVRQVWYEDGLQDGLARGISLGNAEGEQRAADLISLLLEQGRNDDVMRALHDAGYRAKLMKELLE